ncbi:regulator of G protein signaling [Venturia nashicola]|nr:regulator of G protein signaling [Venturia nashicola]
MSNRKSIRPLLRLKTSSTALNSPALSHDESKHDSIIESTKSDEEMTDYASSSVSSRPLSVAIPRTTPFSATGQYCPRRPNLSEILANSAPPPWTLSAFMAYLSQNHCLETLEFTMDASRYRKHYNKMASRSPTGEIIAGSQDCKYVSSLWQKLLEAYIVPNGPREVNIPSSVREGLIEHSNDEVPPHHLVLDTAVQKVYELMEESVLVPFLNSFYPQTAVPSSTDNSRNTSTEDVTTGSRSYDDRVTYRRARKARKTSPPLSQSMSMPYSAPAVQNRSSAPSTFTQFARTLSHSTRQISHTSSHSQPVSGRTSGSAVLSPWSSNQSESSSYPADMGLTDDTSASSPSAFGEPMTPPTTPPQCDYGSPSSVGTSNGFGSRKDSGSTWKKMRSSFGFRKKSGSLREEEMEYV